MAVVKRFDVGELKSPQRTPEGFLRCEGYLTRTGVFHYKTADGKTLRELRHPEDVFDAESLASFGMVPLTNGHPDGFVTPDNHKEHTAGFVAGPRQDGRFVRADVLVTDKAAIKAMGAGRSQLSCGYRAELHFEPFAHCARIPAVNLSAQTGPAIVDTHAEHDSACEQAALVVDVGSRLQCGAPVAQRVATISSIGNQRTEPGHFRMRGSAMEQQQRGDCDQLAYRAQEPGKDWSSPTCAGEAALCLAYGRANKLISCIGTRVLGVP